jgi:flagellar capping protein FliD
MTVTSPTNSSSDAVPGLAVSLRGLIPAGSPATVVVGAAAPSADTIQARLQDFVTQYNSSISFIQSRLNEPRVAKAGSLDEMRKGMLYADSDLSALLRRLRQELTPGPSGRTGDLNGLLDIGLGVGSSGPSGAIDKNALAGQLTLDTAKLAIQLENRLPDVKALLTHSDPDGDGLAQRLTRILTPTRSWTESWTPASQQRSPAATASHARSATSTPASSSERRRFADSSPPSKRRCKQTKHKAPGSAANSPASADRNNHDNARHLRHRRQPQREGVMTRPLESDDGDHGSPHGGTPRVRPPA